MDGAGAALDGKVEFGRCRTKVSPRGVVHFARSGQVGDGSISSRPRQYAGEDGRGNPSSPRLMHTSHAQNSFRYNPSQTSGILITTR